MAFEPATAANSGPMALSFNTTQGDATAWLPASAADKLRALRQHADDLHTVVPEFESIREANMARIEAENRLEQLQAHPQEFGFGLKPDDRRVIEAQRHLDKMTADFKRLTELQEVRTAAWQAASQALAACEAWLRDGRPSGTVLEDYEGEPPKLAKGESITDAIERLRRRGRELRADLHRIASAPYPSSYCKQRMRAQIEALAMQGAPSVALVVEHDRELVFAMRSVTSEVHAEKGALAFAEVPDALALIAWLHRDALVAALDREIASARSWYVPARPEHRLRRVEFERQAADVGAQQSCRSCR